MKLSSRVVLKWQVSVIVLLILILQLPSFNAFTFQSSPCQQDSIKFYEFDGSSYRASSFNYVGVEDEDGILYVGNDNGLLEFDGTHWQLHRKPNFTPAAKLKIVEDKIFVAGGGDIGYFQRNSNGQMVYHSLNDKMETEKIPFVLYIAENNGDIFFTTKNALFVWDGELVKEISHDNLYSISKVEGELLVSVYGGNGGLALLEGDSLKFVNREFDFDNDAAYDIIQKSDGQWIVFTSESGFFTLNTDTYETERWETEASDYYLQDNLYLFGVERFRDSLFVATSWENGIIIFNDEGKILREIKEKDGLKFNIFNSPLADRRGNLWLISAKGLNYLKWCNKNEKLTFDAEARVRYIREGDSTIFIKGEQDNIELTDTKSVSVGMYFSAPSFIREELEFSYYLEGFDAGWSEWTTEARKEYTNLPGGSYPFHLRVRNTDQTALKVKPFEFTIFVPTKWYESSITYVLGSVLLILLITALIKFRTHRLRLANKELEEIVEERTSEISQQKEQLKTANSELKTINNELDNFVYRSSHDLVAPLKSMRGLISLAKSTDNPAEIVEYLGLMKISVNKLEDFIKNIMEFSVNTKKPIEMSLFKVDEVVSSIVEDLKFYDNADKVELIRDYDVDFKVRTDRKRLNIVLRNLVTNALKYHDYKQGKDPYIKVSGRIENESYVIEVEDNGPGIPEEYQQKVFDMFFRAHQGVNGSGLGLYIVKDTLGVLNGKIEVVSTSRIGTTFTVVLPLHD